MFGKNRSLQNWNSIRHFIGEVVNVIGYAKIMKVEPNRSLELLINTFFKLTNDPIKETNGMSKIIKI